MWHAVQSFSWVDLCYACACRQDATVAPCLESKPEVLVALPADGCVVFYPFGFQYLAMWVVACHAAQFSVAGLETAALQKSIGVMVNFETIFGFAAGLIDIQPEAVPANWLSGTISEFRLFEPANSGNGGGR